jgi:hypothetical protein
LCRPKSLHSWIVRQPGSNILVQLHKWAVLRRAGSNPPFDGLGRPGWDTPSTSRCCDKNVIRIPENGAVQHQKWCKSRQDGRGSIFPKLLMTLVWRRFWQDLVNLVIRFATRRSGVRSSPGLPNQVLRCYFWFFVFASVDISADGRSSGARASGLKPCTTSVPMVSQGSLEVERRFDSFYATFPSIDC